MTQNAFAASDAGSLGSVPEPWMDDAVCAQVGTEMFFPIPGGSTAAAKAVCGTCEVRQECLAFALRTGQRYGIWGGYAARHLPKMPGYRGAS